MGRGRRWIEIAISVALAVALVALLVTWDRDDPPTSSTQIPTEAQSTPTPSPSPEPVPTPNTTGNDFKRIWSEINRFYGWLAHNPNPSLLNQIFDSRCPCFRNELRAQKQLVRRGWRYADSEGAKTLSVRVLRRLGPSTILLRVIDQGSDQVVVDENDNVVKKGVGWPPTEWHFTLTRGKDRRWRIAYIVEAGRVESGVDE